MMPASRTTSAGRANLELQKQARAARRPVDEYFQFYVLECFLARLSSSHYSERFVLKGACSSRRSASGVRHVTSTS